MTKVVVVASDTGGCGYLRLMWPGQAVQAVRPDWKVEIFMPGAVETGRDEAGRFVGVRGIPKDTDVLVMQRVGNPAQLFTMRWAQKQGIKVVLDFDDAMWAIDKGNAAYSAWNGAGGGQHWRICDEAAKFADLVTVTTDALAKRYGKFHKRVEVLPNCIPNAALELPSQRGEFDPVFTAGWAGYTRTHPGDCTVSTPAAIALLDEGFALRVVADGPGAAKEWGLEPEQVDAIPSKALGPDYYGALSSMDLMLVGLRDTPFNQAKSALKTLEAGAVGVPSIAPANRPHRAFAKSVPIVLANSPSEWREKALQLARNPGLHQETAQRTRAAIAEGWTIEGNAGRWAAAWERVMR